MCDGGELQLLLLTLEFLFYKFQAGLQLLINSYWTRLVMTSGRVRLRLNSLICKMGLCREFALLASCMKEGNIAS